MSESQGLKPAETYASVPKIYAQLARVNSTPRETIIVFGVVNPFLKDEEQPETVPTVAVFLNHDYFRDFTNQCIKHLESLDEWKSEGEHEHVHIH